MNMHGEEFFAIFSIANYVINTSAFDLFESKMRDSMGADGNRCIVRQPAGRKVR
jgi:hypothetical protein